MYAGHLLSCGNGLCQSPASTSAPIKLDLATKQARLKALFKDVTNVDLGDLFTFEGLRGKRPAVDSWATNTPPKAAEDVKRLEHLYPTVTERWARFEQIKVELIEQPKTVFVQGPTTLVPQLNPTHYLVRNSFLLKPSELFATPDQISSQATAAKEAKIEIQTLPDRLCRAAPQDWLKVAHCLNQSGGRGALFRALQGTSGTISFGSNPQVQQNVLVASGTAIASVNHLFSGEVVFDPGTLFLTGTDWKTGQATSVIYGKNAENAYTATMLKQCNEPYPPDLLLDDNDKRRAELQDSSCIKALAGPHGVKRLAAALIPTVDYKVQTQFDFIKNGANLIAPPFPEGHIWDVTFTADLRRAFTLFKPRADALSAAIAAAKFKPIQTPNSARALVDKLFREWASEPELIENDVWYEGLRAALIAAYDS